MPKKYCVCGYCHKDIEPFHQKITIYTPQFEAPFRLQYYHGDCYTTEILSNYCKIRW